MAAVAGPMVEGEDKIDGLGIAKLAREAMDSKHGEDIRIFDVRGISTVTDFMVVASGSSTPHLKALYAEVQRCLKVGGVPSYRCSGGLEGGWLLLDYVDAVIHIFDHEHRQYYAIEELWALAPQVS